MIVRDVKRLALIAGPALVFIILTFKLLGHTPELFTQLAHDWRGDPSQRQQHNGGKGAGKDAPEGFHEIFSATRRDRAFFRVDFGAGESNEVMNPNIVPHPLHEGVWVAVAQQHKTGSSALFVELACNAVFRPDSGSGSGPDGDGALACAYPPSPLPVEATASAACSGELAYFALAAGPHDARVLYGPDAAYVVYGSNSRFTCFGQFVQDFGRLMAGWESAAPTQLDQAGGEGQGQAEQKGSLFAQGTEIQRPPPYLPIEKNWFLFWDRGGAMYVHHDMYPSRSFARLEPDGSSGPNLAATSPSREADDRCLARYLPVDLPPGLESVHQSTNALSITMCRRADPLCTAGADNTFLFTLVQHKTYYRFHGEYNPYAVLFSPDAPAFPLHAVSRKPLWIHGRETREDGTTTMFYVVSMAWKARGQRYHGYLDDVLLLSFGVEDREAAGMDVVAEDLLADLGLCTEP